MDNLGLYANQEVAHKNSADLQKPAAQIESRQEAEVSFPARLFCRDARTKAEQCQQDF